MNRDTGFYVFVLAIGMFIGAGVTLFITDYTTPRKFITMTEVWQNECNVCFGEQEGTKICTEMICDSELDNWVSK